jgi:hypothetical protein
MIIVSIVGVVERLRTRKGKTVTDNKIQDASWDIVNATRDANQAVANTTVTILDRNLKFAQTTFLSGIEILERETDDLQTLTREWGQHIQKQQEAFQKLAYATMDTYVNFLRSWFSFYQQGWTAMSSVGARELQFAQEAAQRQQAMP